MTNRREETWKIRKRNESLESWRILRSCFLVLDKKIVVWLKNRNKLKETKEDTQHRLLNSLVKKRHASLVEGGNHQDMFITEKGKNRKHSEAFNTFSPIFFILYYRKCKMPAMWFPKDTLICFWSLPTLFMQYLFYVRKVTLHYPKVTFWSYFSVNITYDINNY